MKTSNAIKPIISYYGGKQRLASKIIKLIPPHLMYVEPFFGGGAVMFAKGKPTVTNNDYYHEIINDKDERLINFYRCFQSNFGELMQKICFTPHSESEHQKAKTICQGKIEADNITKAWAYFINIQQSFSNTLNAGWRRTKNTPAKNQAAVWKNQVDRLYDLFDRFSEVSICCDDALKVINQRDSENTFFYCDPPYPNFNQGHYDGYTIKDFQELVDLLATIKGKFLLSNYNQPEILFPDNWQKVEIEATCSATNKNNNKRTEVLWANYKLDNIDQPKMQNEILQY